MSVLYSVDLGVVLDGPAIATGHVATRREWVDGPNGRRPGDEPMRDEQDRPLHVVDVLLPLGRDGQSVVLGVTVPGYEIRAYIRPPKAGKGGEVSLSAEAMHAQGAKAPSRRPTAPAETAEGAA